MDFDVLRSKWRVSLSGETADCHNPYVQNARRSLRKQTIAFWQSMNREPNRSCIWEDLPDPGNPYVRDRVCLATCRRLETMARAWCVEELLSEEFLADLLAALNFLYENWYNERNRKGGEWWHREIGIPLSLNQCVLMLYEELSSAERGNYLRAVESYANPPDLMCIEDIPEESTGANRAWKCLALAQCGILKKDESLLRIASEKIRDIFRYTEHGDGFYRDGSFIQHRKFAYTGGYGVSFLETIVSYMDLTKGTPWCIQKKELDILMEWVMNAYVPLIYRGGFMSMARGREIARKESQEHEVGHQVIYSLMKLSNALSEEKSRKLRGLLKYWITTDDHRHFMKHAPIESIGNATKLLEDPEILPADAPNTCKIYAAMDKVVHHRGNFAAAISMCSERTGRYESIHNENVRGWYTSDGMVYLYNSDLSQFSDDYFPTVNAYRMPGTTVDTVVREEKGIGFGKEPSVHTCWAGGSSLSGRYGAVGMKLEAECSDLRAKKSWFLFDEEIVCLGAGITASQGRKIETIVENRKIHKPMAEILRCDSKASDHESTQWVHLRGPASGSDIGYFFPKKQTLEISEEIRTGSWREINHTSGSEQYVTNRFVNLVIHHGTNPENGWYEYVLLPGKNAEEVQAYSKSPSIEVISNTKQLQAVHHKGLGITAINFWEDEVCSVAGVTCDRKASVLLRETEETIELSVSDPTRKNEEGITIELNKQVSCVISGDRKISVIQMEPTVKLKIDTMNAQGKSFEIMLKYG